MPDFYLELREWKLDLWWLDMRSWGVRHFNLEGPHLLERLFWTGFEEVWCRILSAPT